MTTKDDNIKNENDIDELKKLNELFSKRYTNEDDEYVQMIQRSNSPPVVHDWNQERNTHRPQQFNHNNHHRRYFSNDRQSHRNSSNHYHSYRNRSRSPHHRDTRR
ncbi:unnamed protein product [Rotaria sp. Silwood1]|nr:unnamed protein product [Rotaria sp. Silwood1]CAF0740378.1 unnamed protein product [Rotaria sp. Silwood1]CAF3359316.1 unnamed protein product [Rotaria sp. Silwood1]CAF4581658.1 unnamed protein product [Rotaria sp. Silwood1]